MAEGSPSSSGEDPFLEVKAISRVLSSEATRGPDRPQESFKNEAIAGECFHTLSILRTDQTIRHRSVQHSDSKKHLIAEPPVCRPKSVTYVTALRGCGPNSTKNTSKNPHKANLGGSECDCSCRRENERWQQGQWSGEEWESKCHTTKKAGMCKCVAGAAADCTAVCCCPLSLLHLLALACIKLPSIVVIRTLRKMKTKLRKKQKCQEANEDDACPKTPFTPYLSCKESMSEVSWAPSSGFVDPRMWQEYFGNDTVDLANH